MSILRSALDAAMRTRLFFTPFGLQRYAVVAAVTAFVGVRAGYGSVTNLGAFVLFDGGVKRTEPLALFVAEAVDLSVVGTTAVAVVAFVSAVAEFVLIDVLRNDETNLWRYTRDRIGMGLWLFAFRSVVTAAFVLGTLRAAALVGQGSEAPLATVTVAVLFGLFLSLINGFVTDFVAPIMVVRDCSLLEGSRVLSRILVREPIAFLWYAIARSVANLTVAVGAAVAVVAVTASYGLPVAGVSLASALTSEGLDAVFTTVAGFLILAVAVGISLILVAASVAVLIQLPVRLFFRSWSIYFLGDLRMDYDILESPDAKEALGPISTYIPGTYDNKEE